MRISTFGYVGKQGVKNIRKDDAVHKPLAKQVVFVSLV